MAVSDERIDLNCKEALIISWKDSMDISIAIPGWFRNPNRTLPAQMIKFNRFTMVFNSPRKLKRDQLILINVAAGNHSLRELKARVTQCDRAGHHFQSHVNFVLERPDNQPYRELISVLKAIESAVPASIRSPLHMSA